MTTSPSFPLLAGIEPARRLAALPGFPASPYPYWTMPPRCPLLACSARQGTVAPHSHPPRFVPLSW